LSTASAATPARSSSARRTGTTTCRRGSPSQGRPARAADPGLHRLVRHRREGRQRRRGRAPPPVPAGQHLLPGLLRRPPLAAGAAPGAGRRR